MIKHIEQIFKNRVANPIGKYKKSAVMIFLMEEEGETFILFEVRAQHLRNQPGDICLPGGKVEEGEIPSETVLREAEEELGICREALEWVGEMDYFISPYGQIMYPFIYRFTGKALNPSKEEVDHVFKVPLSFFLEQEPLLYEMEIGPTNQEGFPFHLIRNGKAYSFRKGKLKEYFYQYKGYVIWGFTAQVIKSFVDVLQQE